MKSDIGEPILQSNELMITLQFIKMAHDGQVDKAGEVYWKHPVKVMNALPVDATLVEKQMALLHDVIEDTPFTAQNLLDFGFSAEVVEGVQWLTRPKSITYKHYIAALAVNGGLSVVRVKLADLRTNLKNLDDLPQRKVGGLKERYSWALSFLESAEAHL